jgi:small subunit ribosomal protein S16
MGARHQPFYRLVVSDSRRTPRAKAVDEVGYYDPRAEPPKIEIDGDKVDYWVGKGARMSSSVSRLVKNRQAG